MVQSLLSSFTKSLLNSAVDVSPENVKKQPHFLSIPPPTPHPHIFSEIAMIDNQAFSNSPSLQFRDEPTLQTVNSPSYESSFLDILNTDSLKGICHSLFVIMRTQLNLNKIVISKQS